MTNESQFKQLIDLLVELLDIATVENLEAIDAIAVASLKTYNRLKKEIK